MVGLEGQHRVDGNRSCWRTFAVTSRGKIKAKTKDLWGWQVSVGWNSPQTFFSYAKGMSLPSGVTAFVCFLCNCRMLYCHWSRTSVLERQSRIGYEGKTVRHDLQYIATVPLRWSHGCCLVCICVVHIYSFSKDSRTLVIGCHWWVRFVIGFALMFNGVLKLAILIIAIQWASPCIIREPNMSSIVWGHRSPQTLPL